MRTTIACAGVVAAIAFAGCGGGDSSSTTSSESTSTAAAATSAASTDKIEISDYKFVPATVTVKAGTEVTWTNSDDTAHTATAGDSSFDTGDLDKGDSKSITFDQPGTFAYYCRFHPFMKATVEVQ
ncbi:MAG: hypothetical protein QOI10_1110 [Solirubrobacterales bacterium]|jgi:plastocyanin|nr:hypothetical protein [Solirubrobacterales bacterium]